MKYSKPFVPKKSQQLIEAWINFWSNKWSIFLEWYTHAFHPEISTNRANLFFSINWYKPLSKNRKEENIDRFNCFYFDIDTKDNPDISKTLLQVKLLSYSYFFDFIVESRNGYHLYITLPEGKYASKEEYLAEWKQKAEELENIIDIVFDKNIYDIARISRIPWSLHKKEVDSDYFLLKLIHWEKTLFPQYEKLNQINKIPITEILDVLWVKYSGNTIHTDAWVVTNGYKIKISENYIIDFSHSRPSWEPFAFVKEYFSQKIMKESGKKDEGLVMGITYNFFREHFGIIWSIESSKKIIVHEYIEKFISEEYKSQEQYIIYALMGYYQKQCWWGVVLWKPIKINIADMIQNLSLKITVKDAIFFIEGILEKQKTIYESHLFLSWSVQKEKKKYIFEWIIIPDWNLIRNKREFFIKHYIPFSLFQLNHKNSDISFYLVLCRTFLNQKYKTEITLTKNDLSQIFLQDHNFSRVLKRIQGIQKVVWNFDIRKTQKEVVFIKK